MPISRQRCEETKPKPPGLGASDCKSPGPQTTGQNPRAREPLRIQLAVVPATKLLPSPCTRLRTPPSSSLRMATSPVGQKSGSHFTTRLSLAPPVTIIPSRRTQRAKTGPSCIPHTALVTALYPRPHTRMLPLESPVMRSPEEENARQVKYLGLSFCSRSPVFLANPPDPGSSCQKVT